MNPISTDIISLDKKVFVINRALSHVRIRLTDKCFMKCIYCFKEGFPKKRSRYIGYKLLCNILSALKNVGFKWVIFTGGEPLLYPHLRETLNFTKSLGLTYRITSNMLLFDKKLLNDTLFKNCEYHFSVDTLKPEHYSYISGLNNINLASRNVKKIIETVEQLVQAGTPLQFNTVVTCINDFNFHYSLLDIAGKYNIPVKILASHDSPGGDKITPEEVDKELVRRGAKLLNSELEEAYNKFLYKDVYVQTLKKMYSTLCDSCPMGRCGEGVRFIRIDSDGEVKPCMGISSGIISDNAMVEYIEKILVSARNKIADFGNSMSYSA